MSVVKSRLQLQRQNNVYNGMRHAFVEIVRREGFGALYRGFWMTLPQISASFLYSSTYEKTRDLIQVHLGIRNIALVSALAGGVAAPMAQLVFVPTDIIAQHMMIYNQASAFAGSSRNVAISEQLKRDGLEGRRTLGLRVAAAVYRADGLKGFYRGFISAVMLYIPSSMVFWSVYYKFLDVLKDLRRAANSAKADGAVSEADETAEQRRGLFFDQALSGSMGGVASAIVTNPLEMLRVRLQVHRTTYAETIRRLARYEGRRVFTQGLTPRIVNNALYSCLVMVGYETVKRFSVLPEYREKIIW